MSSKYSPLRDYLRSNNEASLRITFREVAAIVGELPEAAWKYRAWWANNEGFAQARNGWLPAGWKTAHVDMNAQELTFLRVEGNRPSLSPETPLPRQGAHHTNGGHRCLCGCGGIPEGGEFLPGHDQRLRANIEGSAGGLLNLKHVIDAIEAYVAGEMVETELGRIVRRHWGHAE